MPDMRGRRYLRCLLALTTVQHFFLIVSASSCAWYKEKLAPLVCENYSCRKKCNTTVEALLQKGTQQGCHCDERCVVFKDCCADFVSQCYNTFQSGTTKYPEFSTACFTGDFQMITGIVQGPSVSHATTSFTTVETTNNAEGTAAPNTIMGTGWIGDLLYILQMRIDHNFKLTFAPSLYDMERLRPKAFTYSPVQVITANLEAWRSFSTTAYLLESFQYVTYHSLMTGIPKGVIRHCIDNYYKCPNCTEIVEPKTLCPLQLNGSSRNDSQDASKEDDADADSCERHIFAYTDPNYGNKQSDGRHLVKVTVSRDPINGNSTILSQDLPWAIIHCIEHKSGTQFERCWIQSCAVGRLLSPDGLACFIPTRMSVLVVKTVKTINESNASTILSLQNSEDSISTNVMAHQFPIDTQTVASGHKEPPSTWFCVALYQIFHRHTGWTFKRIYFRQTCDYDFTFRSTSKSIKGQISLKNPEFFRKDDVTSDSRSSRRQASTPNSYPNNGHASQINDKNKLVTSNSSKIPNYHPDPFMHANYEDEIKEAWNIIHNSLNALPITDDLMSVNICFESKPEYSCDMKKDPESCRHVMSRCLVYSQLQSAPTTTTMNSFHRNLPWSWCIHLIFILYVFEELKE